tara:strand:- start:1182 stop:1799 length:618 start_codon:yes stop_codon:yes gene_type:complete
MYDKYILPYLLDCTCGQKPFIKQRQKLVPMAKGMVLEVGIGSGLNMPYLNKSNISSFVGVDPSEELIQIAEKRIDDSMPKIDFIISKAEEMKFDDNSFDTVLMTYTICTVEDVSASLMEIKRVLKPDGKLLFCEHGLAPEEKVVEWQNRINKFWPYISGGCNINRDIPQLIEEAGFSIPNMEQMYLPKTPKILGYNYWGNAIKGD